MAVIAIMAILAFISIMAYRSYRHKRLAPEAARRIQEVMRLARDQAIAFNEPCRAAINLTTPTLWLDQGTSTGAFIPKVITPIELPEFVSITSVRVFTTVTTSGIAYVTFNGDGTADPALILVTEDDDKTVTATVRVYASTGRAHIKM